MHTQLWLKDFNEEDHLKDLGPDGHMLVISKRIIINMLTYVLDCSGSG
jgi:hypothetical protein